jgi:26S proteasome regulatory subunit N8
LQGLHLRLRDIGNYLSKVNSGALPVNHTILGLLQDVFNLLPNLSTPSADGGEESNELSRALAIKTNDQLMNIYLSSLIRAIIAFHDLIDNKIKNRQDQAEGEGEGEGEKDKAEKKDEKSAEKDGKKDDTEKKGGIDKDLDL